MGIGDWDIFAEMARLHTDLDRFSEALRRGFQPDERDQWWAPPVDIHEQEDSLVLLVDLPGVRREDIDLRVDRDSLTIEGERAPSASGGGLRLERPAGRFRRSFRIGISVDPSGAQASYQDGVLRVVIPRAQPSEPDARRVDVQ